jgi:hypothetical protein
MKMEDVKSKSKNFNKSAKAISKGSNTIAVQAKRQAKKILTALDEAKQIHSGKKEGKSFNEFLKEL